MYSRPVITDNEVMQIFNYTCIENHMHHGTLSYKSYAEHSLSLAAASRIRRGHMRMADSRWPMLAYIQ